MSYVQDQPSVYGPSFDPNNPFAQQNPNYQPEQTVVKIIQRTTTVQRLDSQSPSNPFGGKEDLSDSEESSEKAKDKHKFQELNNLNEALQNENENLQNELEQLKNRSQKKNDTDDTLPCAWIIIALTVSFFLALIIGMSALSYREFSGWVGVSNNIMRGLEISMILGGMGLGFNLLMCAASAAVYACNKR